MRMCLYTREEIYCNDIIIIFNSIILYIMCVCIPKCGDDGDASVRESSIGVRGKYSSAAVDTIHLYILYYNVYTSCDLCKSRWKRISAEHLFSGLYIIYIYRKWSPVIALLNIGDDIIRFNRRRR